MIVAPRFDSERRQLRLQPLVRRCATTAPVAIVGADAFGRQTTNVAGRFAPSPSGPLHLGNLRTAIVAWLAARSEGRGFSVRIEDLDPVTSLRVHEDRQLSDLAALGIDWDGPVVRQSERLDIYQDVIRRLDDAGLVYRCFCTRREIREQIEAASRAPQVTEPGDLLPDLAYPGTCREIDSSQSTGQQRPPALRLRTDAQRFTVDDHIAGQVSGGVDDMVLARSDELPAYNLAVVVDDHLQGVDQVVRGDDLLSSTPRQMLLYQLLGWEPPQYWHVPLVMDGDVRLAKRSGGVTLAELIDEGWSASDVLATFAASLGMGERGEALTIERLLQRFDPELIPRQPVDLSELV